MTYYQKKLTNKDFYGIMKPSFKGGVRVNITKRFFALLTSLSLVVALAGCSNQKQEYDITLDEVLGYLSDETNFDESLHFAPKIGLSYDEHGKREVVLQNAISQLENTIEMITLFQQARITPTTEATSEIVAKYSNKTFDDLKLLLESYQGNELSDIERARLKAGLSYVYGLEQQWIEENGLYISEQALTILIKAAACEASGLEEEYIASCEIIPEDNNSKSLGTVKITDPVSNEILSYSINRDSSPISSALALLNDIQTSSDEDFSSIYGKCVKTLDITKLSIAAGIVSDNGVIKSEKTTQDAKRLLLTISQPQVEETAE